MPSSATDPIPPVQLCAGCNTELGPSLLACPACGRLVHGERLKQLAALAEAATREGDLNSALVAWREAIVLLPPVSKQRQVIAARIDDLTAKGAVLPDSQADAAKKTANAPGWAKKGGPLGAIGLFLWKMKFVFLAFAGKAKFLLLGLTKASTLFSMLLSMGVYWTLFGWKFAVGFVLSIYVHEMGHVAALRRRGIPATAPMFIPGIGALVRLKQYPMSPVEDSRVGLAGPVWGTAAAIGCLLIHHLTGSPLFAALAHTGAYINLFNLIPVWQLDGSRGFSALAQNGRLIAAGVVGVAWMLSGQSLLAILFLCAGARAFGQMKREKTDMTALVTYAVLVMTLAWLAMIEVPGAAN